ncbi:Ferric vibriobactin enterobactin transport system permease protein ViuD [Vibrio tapetis subsp. tapetis]|uniref:Ferric vibriobactin enterobactin transport system permease protein ViuD n=2 Tax=Vibrio tapetis TaxID=52443 RepID=A0A2N8ZJP3_9VIBR|nr:iron ABC transporter permease [Vibrio tapetis]SON52086.1 Ferric vibriobactin enterobactin transport system permease protein ViuD [Vibrio tapetis subsp. tapetis]
MTQLAHPIARRNKRQVNIVLIATLISLPTLMLISIFIGSRDIAVATTLEALFHFDANNSQHLIVHHLRIPRTLLAVIVGAALGVSGIIMQALTRNPLAEPGILGVNAGAMTMIVLGISIFGMTSLSSYVWLGLLGAAMTGFMVYLIAGKGRKVDAVRVVLSGTALTIMLLAITSLITINSHQDVFHQYRHWSVGSLQGRGYDVLYPVSLFIAVGLLLSLALAKPLDSIVLGFEKGLTLGVNPALIWGGSFIVVTILAGSATAAAGPISFLGLTAPHITKLIVGTDHKKLLPASMSISALLLLIADILGRIVGYPNEISAGIMVALIGGPFFLYLIRR